jgi:N-acetylglutamate synthase-like GNAT family acetyltransferase
VAKVNSESTIRQATTKDNAKLREIIDLSFPRFFRDFANSSVKSEDGKVLVAERHGIILGFAKLIEFNIGSQKYGCILWIAVHPSYRRRGTALNLTTVGTETLKKNDAQAVFASTQIRNSAAKATLGKADFRRMGFLGLWRVFGWQLLSFYRKIWYAPGEIVFMHS